MKQTPKTHKDQFDEARTKTIAAVSKGTSPDQRGQIAAQVFRDDARAVLEAFKAKQLDEEDLAQIVENAAAHLIELGRLIVTGTIDIQPGPPPANAAKNG